MRELKTIKLSECEVSVLSYILWGEKEAIQEVLTSGAKIGSTGLNGFDFASLREAKYKAFELVIKKITKGEEEIKYSREWVDNLSVEDGDLLYEEVNQITNPKKKAEQTLN